MPLHLAEPTDENIFGMGSVLFAVGFTAPVSCDSRDVQSFISADKVYCLKFPANKTSEIETPRSYLHIIYKYL
jgi:hypothetical protein